MQIITNVISPIVTFFLGIFTMIIKNIYDDDKKNHENNPMFTVTNVTTYKEIDNQVCYFTHVNNALYHSMFADLGVLKIKISNPSNNPAYDVNVNLDNETIHIDVIEENSSVFIIPSLHNKEELDKKFQIFLNYYQKYHDTFLVSSNTALLNKYTTARDEVIACFNTFPKIIKISFGNKLNSYYAMSFKMSSENTSKMSINNPYIIKKKMHKEKKKYNLSESDHKNVTKASKEIPLSF